MHGRGHRFGNKVTSEKKENLTMSDNSKKKYLWVVEWDNPFAQHKNRGMLFYSITLLPDVEPEDFEKFMKEEAFPAIDGILTRAIRFGPQYLLEDAGEEGPDPLDNHQVIKVVKKLESLAARTLDNRFFIMTGPEHSSSE